MIFALSWVYTSSTSRRYHQMENNGLSVLSSHTVAIIARMNNDVTALVAIIDIMRSLVELLIMVIIKYHNILLGHPLVLY